jgi:hypothetical protein
MQHKLALTAPARYNFVEKDCLKVHHVTMKMKKFWAVACIFLTVSLSADGGSPNIRPSEEAGDLAQNPYEDDDEPLPQDEDQITLEQNQLIESADQQMENPFVPSRFKNETPNHNSLLVFFVSVALFASGLIAANAHRGRNAT